MSRSLEVYDYGKTCFEAQVNVVLNCFKSGGPEFGDSHYGY
jgi:hypothetical protein